MSFKINQIYTVLLPVPIYSTGKQPTMVDYLIWPWIERLPMIKDSSNNPQSESKSNFQSNKNLFTSVSSSAFPHLYKWMLAMFELPAVKETMFDVRSHQIFGRSQLTADPVYDMGLENEPPLPSVEARL